MKLKSRDGAYFDPETVEVLKAVLDDAWTSLQPDQQAQTTKADMASRILEAAARGELDPQKLKTIALVFAVPISS